jgi:hypothetical protein
MGQKQGVWIHSPDSIDIFAFIHDRIRVRVFANDTSLFRFVCFDKSMIKSVDSNKILSIKANYYNNALNGEYGYYIYDTIPILIGQFTNGKKNGVFNYYNCDMLDPWYQVNYYHDLIEGDMLQFFTDSKVEYREVYIDGQIVYSFSYDVFTGLVQCILPYKNNVIKNGKYIFRWGPDWYWINKYRKGHIVKKKLILDNRVIKKQKRGKKEKYLMRPYYKGIIRSFFQKNEKSSLLMSVEKY